MNTNGCTNGYIYCTNGTFTKTRARPRGTHAPVLSRSLLTLINRSISRSLLTLINNLFLGLF